MSNSNAILYWLGHSCFVFVLLWLPVKFLETTPEIFHEGKTRPQKYL